MLATAPRITEGTLQTSEGRPLPLESTDVKGVVQGPLATVELRQKFRNTTAETIEATYLFPLSHNASVFHMEFRIEDRIVKGVVKEKEEARRTYEAARAQGRAATLLEQERPNLFTLSVANIASGASIEVFLQYQELVPYDAGVWRFVFPLVASERYEASEEIEALETIRPPRARRKDRISPVSVSFEIRNGRSLTVPESPSHSISVISLENGHRLHLAEGSTVPNRDFILRWTAESEQSGRLAPQIWFDREQDKPGTFCLYLPAPRKLPSVLRPPQSGRNSLQCGNCGAPMPDKNAICQVEGLGPAWKCEFCGVMHPVEQPRSRPTESGRDILFLIDRSASIGNSDLGAEAVRQTLEMLPPEDNFKIVAFHHELEYFQEDWTACTEGAVSRATDFLAGLSCKGGTEMDLVLRLATDQPRPGRSKIVVLITDGAVGNEGRFLKTIADSVGESRLFVLGVGPAPNRYLIEKMAQLGRGAFDVVTAEEPETLPHFAGRIARAKPVLSDVRLSWLSGTGMDMYPCQNLELFAGKSLWVLGRFIGEGPASLELRGTTAEGAPFVQVLPCELPQIASTPGLERAWAGRRVDDLQDQLIKKPSRLSDIRLEVLGLALKHSLVTPYTSLVADDSVAGVDPSASFKTVAVEPPSTFTTMGVEAPKSVMPRSAAPLPPSPSPAAPPPPSMDFMEMERSLPRSEEVPFGLTSTPMLESTTPARAITTALEVPNQAPVLPPREHSYTTDELERARELVTGSLDLVFLIDETGSMGPYIAQVQAHLLALIDSVRQSPLCSSLRLGLVTFRDHPPQEESFVTRVVPLTENIEEIAEGVKRMQANGGGDGPEAVTDGIMELLNLNWSEGSTRLVVMVGDAPPHGVEPSGDGFPAGCPCGRHWYTQAESCREMNIVIHTVGCRGISRYTSAQEVFKSVAQRTGGLYFPLSDAQLLINLVSGLADRQLDRRRLEELVREVFHQHTQELSAADTPEQVRFLTQILQAKGIRVLDFLDESNSKLGFRNLRRADIELAWDGGAPRL